MECSSAPGAMGLVLAAPVPATIAILAPGVAAVARARDLVVDLGDLGREHESFGFLCGLGCCLLVGMECPSAPGAMGLVLAAPVPATIAILAPGVAAMARARDLVVDLGDLVSEHERFGFLSGLGY